MSKRISLEKDLTGLWSKSGWDQTKEALHIQAWIREYFEKNNLSVGVIGLSGGLDSSVVAYLCVEALGAERIRGLLLPEREVTAVADMADAKLIAGRLGIETTEYDISPLVSAFASQNPKLLEKEADGSPTYRTQLGNVKARIRMIKLYEEAQMRLENSCVLGTTDRSEWLMGYFTKYGDGGVDVEPVLGVYKTQMRALAKMLGVPDVVLGKPSSPNLISGLSAEQELGLSYEELDTVLAYLIDQNYLESNIEQGKKRLKDECGIGDSVTELVLSRLQSTAHKRAMPPSPPRN